MYIKLDTEFIANELPGELTRDAQGNSRAPTDAEMVAAGWYRFTVGPRPEAGAGQKVTYTRATNGADCVQSWSVVPLSAAELAALQSLPRRITKTAFRNRFTATEKVVMEMASLDNPAGSMAQRQQAAMLRVSLADTAVATFIDLARLDTRAGVQMLESAGILAAGRALQILDAPIQPEERPL